VEAYLQMIDELMGSLLCELFVMTFAVPLVVWALWRGSQRAADKITQHVLGK
jgi:uncharacterized Tic20 family protein